MEFPGWRCEECHHTIFFPNQTCRKINRIRYANSTHATQQDFLVDSPDRCVGMIVNSNPIYSLIQLFWTQSVLAACQTHAQETPLHYFLQCTPCLCCSAWSHAAWSGGAVTSSTNKHLFSQYLLKGYLSYWKVTYLTWSLNINRKMQHVVYAF